MWWPTIQRCTCPNAWPFLCTRRQKICHVRWTKSIPNVWQTRKPSHVPDGQGNPWSRSIDCSRPTTCTVTRCHFLGPQTSFAFRAYNPTTYSPTACTDKCWANIDPNLVSTIRESSCCCEHIWKLMLYKFHHAKKKEATQLLIVRHTDNAVLAGDQNSSVHVIIVAVQFV